LVGGHSGTLPSTLIFILLFVLIVSFLTVDETGKHNISFNNLISQASCRLWNSLQGDVMLVNVRK
jgi:hypothetical protein